MRPLTILIPTFERPYIERVLVFLKAHLDDDFATLIVLDGSVGRAQENKRLCEQHSVAYENFGPELHFSDRLLAGIRLVNTPFCLIHADDDLVNPAGLIQAIDFLEKNDDYVCAHGKYIGFEGLDDNKIVFSNVYGAPYPEIISVEQDLVIERLLESLGKFLPLVYAPVKTDLLETVFCEIAESLNGIDADYIFDELVMQSMLPIYGKIRQFDSFYMAKAMGQSLERNARPPEKYILESQFFEKYQRYLNAIKKHLSKCDQLISYPEWYVESAVDLSFFSYLWMNLNPETARRRLISPRPRSEDIFMDKLARIMDWVPSRPGRIKRKAEVAAIKLRQNSAEKKQLAFDKKIAAQLEDERVRKATFDIGVKNSNEYQVVREYLESIAG